MPSKPTTNKITGLPERQPIKIKKLCENQPIKFFVDRKPELFSTQLNLAI